MQLMVPHGMPSMSVMQDPPKSFCRIVGHVENARDMLHEDVSLFTPILDCKELHINVVRMCSGLALVYHCDSCLIVFVESSGLLLRKAKVFQDRPQIPCCLCCMNCSNKFCLSQTCGNHSLQLGLVCNSCTCVAECPACDRSSFFNIHGMCCIDKPNKL